MAGQILLMIVGMFLIVLIICLIGVVWEMNQVDDCEMEEELDYWDYYWEREDDDGEDKTTRQEVRDKQA